jgi:glutamine synthetase
MKEFAKFGELIFDPTKSVVSKGRNTSAGKQYVDFVQSNKINFDDADRIAKEVLEWAKAQGVTHYTFWIQPLTNETLEKHEAFFELEYVYNGSESSKKIDKFNGMTLMKG